MKRESCNGHQPTNHVPHMYCVTVPKLTEEPNAVNKKNNFPVNVFYMFASE